jgi:adenylate kinase
MSSTRAALARRHSERLARRALGLALDADLTDRDATTLLIDLSERDRTLLRLARAQVLEAAAQGPACRRALELLSLAMAGVGDEREVLADRTCVVITGAPGAGKGTQGSRLAEHLDLVHISTGELLREAAEQESAVGLQARAFMECGRLVPDDVVMDALTVRLAKIDVARRGFILDGVPRTVNQARALEELLGPSAIEVVIELVVCGTTALTRLQRRNRDDHSTVALRQRFADYEAQNRLLRAWYQQRSTVWQIDGERPPAAITAEIVERLGRQCALRQDVAQ